MLLILDSNFGRLKFLLMPVYSTNCLSSCKLIFWYNCYCAETYIVTLFWYCAGLKAYRINNMVCAVIVLFNNRPNGVVPVVWVRCWSLVPKSNWTRVRLRIMQSRLLLSLPWSFSSRWQRHENVHEKGWESIRIFAMWSR